MRSEYINREVLELLIRKMGRQNALAVELSLLTGLRIGDCLKTRVIDLQDGNLFYVAEKTGKPGVTHIGEEMEKRLRVNSLGTPFCFPGRDGSKPRTRQTVYTDLKKCAKELGITENVTPHTARKVFAVEELKHKTFAEVQEELQHSDSSVTMLYACADRLNGFQNGNSRKSAKKGEKVQKNELLTPKICENCIFEIGIDNFVDIVIERVLRAIE